MLVGRIILFLRQTGLLPLGGKPHTLPPGAANAVIERPDHGDHQDDAMWSETALGRLGTRGIGGKVSRILWTLGPPLHAAICKMAGGHVVSDTDAEQERPIRPIDILVHLPGRMNDE